MSINLGNKVEFLDHKEGNILEPIQVHRDVPDHEVLNIVENGMRDFFFGRNLVVMITLPGYVDHSEIIE